MKRDDSLWKSLLEDIFDDFLRFFIPDAEDFFNFDKGFIFLDKELNQLFPPAEDEFQPRYVDKLIKVFTRQGAEEWILVHIEVQGYRDNAFAKRMYEYYARIFDKYQKSVVAFAILTDRHRSFKPDFYESSLLGTTLTYRYNVYKVIEQDQALLSQNPNPFAVVIMTVLLALQKRRLTETQLFDLKVDLAKRLLIRSYSKPKIRTLLNFLRFYIRFENPDSIVKFDQQIDSITNQPKNMGLEEFLLYRAEKLGMRQGLAQGIEQQNKLLIQNLLTQTDFTVEKIASLVGVSTDVVVKIKTTLEQA